MRQAFDVAGPQQAYQAVCQLYKHWVKPQVHKGAQGRISWETFDPESREAMRKLFHGPLLADFAEQVWLMDPATDRLVRYMPSVWKLHLKDLFCPITRDKDGKWGKSTERLSDAQYAEFITACQAFGVNEWNVVFTEQEPC